MKTNTILTALALGASAWMATAQDDGAMPAGGSGSWPGPGQGQHPLPPLVAVLDANHDGVIDAGEIADASAALKSLDKNGDGKLTVEELRPAPVGGGRPDGARPDGFRREGIAGGQAAPGGVQMPPMRAHEQLKLSDEQKEQIEAIHAEMKARLDEVLTPEQLEQMKNMRPPMRQGGQVRPPRGPQGDD